MDALRCGRARELPETVGHPRDGEALEMVALRHRSGDKEAQLCAYVDDYPPW